MPGGHTGSDADVETAPPPSLLKATPVVRPSGLEPDGNLGLRGVPGFRQMAKGCSSFIIAGQIRS